MKAMVQLVPYLALVVIQDALELTEEFPENRVHAYLLKIPEFRYFKHLCMF